MVSQLALAHETGQLTPGCHVRQDTMTSSFTLEPIMWIRVRSNADPDPNQSPCGPGSWE